VTVANEAFVALGVCWSARWRFGHTPSALGADASFSQAGMCRGDGRSRGGLQPLNPRIKSLSGASSARFTDVRAAAQTGCAYSDELDCTGVNCNPGSS
jgi:hypothetical protein